MHLLIHYIFTHGPVHTKDSANCGDEWQYQSKEEWSFDTSLNIMKFLDIQISFSWMRSHYSFLVLTSNIEYVLGIFQMPGI